MSSNGIDDANGRMLPLKAEQLRGVTIYAEFESCFERWPRLIFGPVKRTPKLVLWWRWTVEGGGGDVGTASVGGSVYE